MVKVVKGLPAEWGMCSRTVVLDSFIYALSYHDSRIAIGSGSWDIIIINAITGSQAAVFSGHMKSVYCLTFSSDGTSLVSGSDDKTVKLWDTQTGGVIKTFSGHTHAIFSVSISVDHTIIASGSDDHVIRLWDIQRGECKHVIRQQNAVQYINFSPTDPKYLISICKSQLCQWNTDGHQIKPPSNSSHIAFSSDGTQFVSCYGAVVTVQNSDSGAIVTEFQVTSHNPQYCCFSPDDRLVAIADGNTAYIWDITSSIPHLIETFIGHTRYITSLAFSSPTTLISTSLDRSVKFWQIGAPSIDPAVIGPKSTFPTSAPIKSITPQKKDGIAITSDSDGIVKIWDISTGLCKASFQTPAKFFDRGDAQLINGRLIFVWNLEQKIYVWDAVRGEHLLGIYNDWEYGDWEDIRISEDGSRVFSLNEDCICTWSVQKGEVVDSVVFEHSEFIGSLTVDGSKVWAYWPQSKYQGWDFGIPGSPPIHLSNMPILTNGNMLWDPSQARIKNAVTGEVVFQLSGRFSEPIDVQCDGSYLVAGYQSGEILILELKHVLL